MMEVEEQIAQPASAYRNGAAVWLDRIRLRARRRALWVRAASVGAHEGTADGMAIFHAEVERILEDPRELAAKESQFYCSDPEALQLSELIRTADQAFVVHPAIEALRSWFGISPFEIDLLNLAVAVEIDPMLRRAYAYLNDNAGATHPTQWLAARLCEHETGELLGPYCPLVDWCLARPREDAGNRWGVDAPWAADPYFVHWLLGRNVVDPALGGAIEFVGPHKEDSEFCLYPDELLEMVNFVGAISNDRANGSRPAIAIELVGPEGSGKRTLAVQFAAALNAGLLCADAQALLGGDTAAADASERIIRVMRMARLTGTILYWANSDHVPPRVWQPAERSYGVMMFGSLTANLSRPGTSQRLPLGPSTLSALKRRTTHRTVATIPQLATTLPEIEDGGNAHAGRDRQGCAESHRRGMEASIEARQESLRLV